MKAQAIFIEAGHGAGLIGRDSGAVGTMGGSKITEREFTVKIARAVLALLKTKEELNGILVQGVGVENETSIQKKMKFVNYVMKENQLNPGLCFGVAIHMNAGKGGTGFEVWYQRSGASLEYGKSIVASWGQYGILPLRPTSLNSSKNGRFGRFYIDDTAAKYVIVETGFVTNDSDTTTLWNNIDRAAEAIAHGILTYIRNL